MKKALIIGGSGGLSGRLATLAQENYEVWALTRGKRTLPAGVNPITADREDANTFTSAIENVGLTFDVVFDCICMNENHAKQDLEVLSRVSRRLVVISTDSVYDFRYKKTPQTEEGIFVEETGTPQECSYAGNKRKMEHIFLQYFEAQNKDMDITVFRPGHIYGPGFLLGCYPEHSRQEGLADKILQGEEIRLVGGGIYLTQPIFVDDLAKAMLDCVDKPDTYGQIFCIGGPEAVENKRYYEIIGELLGVPVKMREVPLQGYLEEHPGYEGHLCHRIYDLSKLKSAHVPLPATSLTEGIKKYLEKNGYNVC